MSYNNNQYWYHYDEHGSVIRMTDKDGKTVAKYKYDDLGNNAYKWGTTGTGSEIDKYYLKARYYDAEIGRFLAKDSIAVRIGKSCRI